EAQFVCYMEAEQKPGYYVVKSRDTGEILKFFSGYKGKYPPAIQGFSELPINMTFDWIMDRINSAELAVREGELPEYQCDEKERRYCRYRYLCFEEEIEKEAVEVTQTDVVAAAELYREGKIFEGMGKERVDQAKEIIHAYAKAQGVDNPFKVGGLSVKYRGQKQRTYIKEDLLKSLVSEELLEKVIGKTKAWDDVYIRVLKSDD
ncbi:hypothetical protein LCGC14_2787910, partial [marine sediment metagenome]